MHNNNNNNNNNNLFFNTVQNVFKSFSRFSFGINYLADLSY
jgi:hypothetical protein